MKRFLIAAILILIIAAILISCSQNNGGPSPSPTGPTYVPYPDSEINRDNYNNGMAMTLWDYARPCLSR